MRSLKYLVFFIEMAIILSFSFYSCSKGYEFSKPEVEFRIYNYDFEEISKKDSKDPAIPLCSNETASYVVAVIESGAGVKNYVIELAGDFEFSRKTKRIRLDQGEHKLLSFKVYSESGKLIFNAPENSSYYASLWSLQGVGERFYLKEYRVSRFDIDVLCYQN